ncbi:MAG: hypothetical protein EBT06_13770 [Gammaproteobacteria bacterium]|nr:hypothetical protein [Gammaproteobacteria bacterium]NBT45941.1 hypothetical protein [Gammaproteobacteria bacterium]
MPTLGAAPIGTFDMSSIIRSVNNMTGRPQVFIETSFDKSFMRQLNQPKSLCGASKTAEW